MRHIFVCLIILLGACSNSPQQLTNPQNTDIAENITATFVVSDTPRQISISTNTPTSTNTLVPTTTPTDTSTPTITLPPDMETMVAAGNMTNVALEATLLTMWTATPSISTQIAAVEMTNQVQEVTLSAMWTLIASTSTPIFIETNTPIPSSTNTATATPLPVVRITPNLVYMRSTANLRVCPSTDCDQVTQLRENDAVMVTGRINSEAINGGSNSTWYRVDYRGQQVYVHSELVSHSLPTPVPFVTFGAYEVPAYRGSSFPVAPTTHSYNPSVVFPTRLPEFYGGGATARCRDGTLSYSARRRGTCSHHGGVSVWLNR